MKKLFFAVPALTILLVGCGQDQVAGGNVEPGRRGEAEFGKAVEFGESSYFIGDTVTYENVAVVPLIAKDYDSEQDSDYLTLAEATKNDWIEIIEKLGDETVSELTVRYSGPKPLLLLAGELLLGGKQDRVVAKDTVIDPISTVVVPVYCVEPGRWSGGSMGFTYSGHQVPMSVKEEVMLNGQSEVWDSTGDFNSIVGVTNGATTLDAGLNMREVTEFTDKGREGLKRVLDSSDPVVGLVFIIDGKIRTMEIFGAPRLLESSYSSIISGILAEAAISDGESKGLPTRAELLDFLKEASEAQATAGLGADRLSGFITFDDEDSSIAGGFMRGAVDGKPGVAHGSYINKRD